MLRRYKNGPENVGILRKLMRKNFEIMKNKAGVFEKKVEEDDKLDVDEIFKKLRPKSPYKLSEMLQPSFNHKKKRDILRSEVPCINSFIFKMIYRQF